LTALCAAAGARLMALHPAFADDRRKQRNFALLLLAVLLFFDTPVYFFDRDHIMFALAFPYMLRFMPSLARKRLSPGLRCTVALLAALGFCMKPHALIVFAALQLLFILRERSGAILWSPENLAVYGGWAIYLLCVRHFAPDYLRVVLPMAAEAYSGFSR